MTTATERKPLTCYFEWAGYPHPGCAEFGPPDTYSCTAAADRLVWVPPQTDDAGRPLYGETVDGTVLPACPEHGPGLVRETPGAEFAWVRYLPMTCAGCGYPVWAAHAAEHGGPCDFCEMNGLLDLREKGQHATCSCPEEAAWVAAMDAEEAPDG